jgi:amidohydrolase
MKTEINKIIDEQQDEMIAFGKELFMHPELGYKEFETKKLVQEELEKYGINVEAEYFETGFQVSIGQGLPHIGLIAELDAIPVEGHPCSNPKDHAAHACGHSTQVAIMVNAIIALKKSGLLEQKGKVTLFFTPGEEYTDLDYRRKLIQEGKIRFIGGKMNMLEAGVFGDCDCIIHLHAMGSKYAYGYGSSLAGFKYKKIIFKGKASHAGVLPHLGINALNEFTLFNTALGMLRETFEENDMVRIHGILTKGGDTINSVPSEVIYECYIRTLNQDKLLEIDRQITSMAQHCAAALGGTVEFADMIGYLPFTPNPVLSEVAHQNILDYTTEDKIIANERSIAGGDVGDVSCFYPIIQFGYNGFSGAIHGVDFKIVDTYKAFVEPAKIVCGCVVDLLEKPKLITQIKASHHSMDKEVYTLYLQRK